MFGLLTVLWTFSQSLLLVLIDACCISCVPCEGGVRPRGVRRLSDTPRSSSQCTWQMGSNSASYGSNVWPCRLARNASTGLPHHCIAWWLDSCLECLGFNCSTPSYQAVLNDSGRVVQVVWCIVASPVTQCGQYFATVILFTAAVWRSWWQAYCRRTTALQLWLVVTSAFSRVLHLRLVTLGSHKSGRWAVELYHVSHFCHPLFYTSPMAFSALQHWTASPTKEGCHWQAGGKNRQTRQLANPAWYS